MSAVLSSSPALAPERARAAAPLLRSLGVLCATLAGLASAWWAGRHSGLQAASDLGYWIGVAGGLAMLALFAYPLRKRVRWMRHLGATRAWFIAHMVLGLSGPWLILVHCGFRIGSLNAAVALVSMLVVAGSGLVGRYLYVQIHHGLSGQRTELHELHSALHDGHARTVASLAQAPAARDLLLGFEEAVLRGGWRPGASPWPMLRLTWRARRTQRRVMRAVDAALRRSPPPGGEPARRALRRTWARQSRAHLSQVLRVAHFASWERLFSLWHVLHLPFVYLMVVCALVHVVAVHAY